MASRYLVYRTDYGNTIVYESATPVTTGSTQSFYTDFVIPEIQPLYLWRVNTDAAPFVEPNTDQNISDWLDNIAPPPEPDDNATVGFVTGITANKIDTVTGITGNIGTFKADGNLEDGGYTIPEITGLTTYTFVESGGTTITQVGNTVNIFSTVPTGTTVSWGNITGTLANQTDLQNALNAKTDNTIFTGYTATTQPILDAALTGVTDLGTGTTLGGTSGRNVTIKSISVLGSLSISGDANNLIISGGTGGGAGTITGGTNGLTTNGQNIELGGTLTKSTSIDGNGFDFSMFNVDSLFFSASAATYTDVGNWGGITYSGDYSADYIDRSLVDAGYVTGITSTKLDSTIFYNYTGVTNTRLEGIESDIVYLSGQTDLKLNISDFNTYSGTTETRLEGIEDDITGLTATKLDITLFNSYTGTTETRLSGIESDIVELSAVTSIALTGATNGLSTSGRDAILGGTLTQDTVISGTTFDFTLNTADILIQAAGTGGVNIVDTDGTTGVIIESDGGDVTLIGNTAGSVEVTKLSISETAMTITDGRGTPVGLEYAADYSATFVNESLVTKRYVDAVALGLTPKAAVMVTTTTGDGDIDLTGGTFSAGTIDGYTLLDGDRVLITQQTDGAQNGIYDYDTATSGFTRSSDFDGNPSGEVTSGNLIPVTSGATLYSTIWVLVTENPITVGTTDLEFTLFSQPHDLIAGVGIDISGNTISVDGVSLEGSSIKFTGDTFNVDTTTGNVATALALKLDISDFNTYSGATDTRLDDIETDITTLSGATEGKLDTVIFTGYTASTETRLTGIESDITYISGVTDTKLDSDIFTGYTATTASNEIFLTHTGGTDINTIAVTAIDWDSVVISGTSFLWSGDTDIYIKKAGDYEISYNIPFNSDTTKNIAIGSNVIKNNSIVLDLTAAASGGLTDTGSAGSLGLPTVVLTLAFDDKLTLGAFRTGKSGTVETSLTGSILIKEKNTLQ